MHILEALCAENWHLVSIVYSLYSFQNHKPISPWVRGDSPSHAAILFLTEIPTIPAMFVSDWSKLRRHLLVPVHYQVGDNELADSVSYGGCLWLVLVLSRIGYGAAASPHYGHGQGVPSIQRIIHRTVPQFHCRQWSGHSLPCCGNRPVVKHHLPFQVSFRI